MRTILRLSRAHITFLQSIAHEDAMLYFSPPAHAYMLIRLMRGIAAITIAAAPTVAIGLRYRRPAHARAR